MNEDGKDFYLRAAFGSNRVVGYSGHGDGHGGACQLAAPGRGEDSRLLLLDISEDMDLEEEDERKDTEVYEPSRSSCFAEMRVVLLPVCMALGPSPSLLLPLPLPLALPLRTQRRSGLTPCDNHLLARQPPTSCAE